MNNINNNNNSVPADVAAQAQAKREAAAAINFGAWKEILLPLAKELPHDSGTKSIQDILTYLKEKENSNFISKLENMKLELQGVWDLNNDEAEKWKEQGNKSYTSGKFEESILMYTRGIMYAKEDETLAILINNRSIVFLAQGRISEALLDAHIAFSLSPNYWKSLNRRGVCLQKLGFEKEGLKDIEAAEKKNSESVNSDEFVMEIIKSKINNNNLRFSPGLSIIPPKIEISYGNNIKGVIAKNRLESGEIINETPIVHALYDDHWGMRCCYCLQSTRNLYPGIAYRLKGKISRGLFCSEDCARINWELYGQYETENSFFQLCPTDTLIASRLLRLENFNSCKYNFRGNFSGELYPASIIGGYETLISLIALIFGAVNNENIDRFRINQRQVLLSGIEIKFYTGSQITINSETKESFIDESKPIIVGKGIYITASYFRHSCKPNCFLSFIKNPLDCSLNLTIRAIKDILIGEELTIAYHNMTTYKAVSAHTRRRALIERCGFICNCSACIENKDERVNSEKKDFYIQASDLYQKGCRLIREGQYETAIIVLTQSYTIAMEHLCPPPRPPQSMIPKTHMALAKAFNRNKNNEKCAEHLLAKLKLEEEIYKGDYVEVIDDYIRLAFFASTEDERRKYAEKGIELLHRFYAPSKEIDAQINRLESFIVRHHS